MNVLVINCGSSSVKFQLIDMSREETLISGLCERIGINDSRIVYEHSSFDDKVYCELELKDHKTAIKHVIDYLLENVLNSLDDINVVGHRVVHGGEAFTESTIIDDNVIKGIIEAAEMAPLHNPQNLIGIQVCQDLMPNIEQVAVFDTAFHQSMEAHSYLYAIPYKYYSDYKIRKYGFHGTSHKYVAYRTAEILEKDVKDLKTIVCHLGNGASVCAVDGGKSVDTSMGLTPLEGLVMGTRSGDLDPAVIQMMMNKDNKSIDDIITVLNKESGVKGVSGTSSDFRDLEKTMLEGDLSSKLAIDLYVNRVAKYIGAYAAVLNGVDVISFTAGIGENSSSIRQMICEKLTYLGVGVDKTLNECRGVEKDVSLESARVKTIVVPTNEELMIAREAISLV